MTNVFPLRSGVDQNIATHASPTARNAFLVLISTYPCVCEFVCVCVGRGGADTCPCACMYICMCVCVRACARACVSRRISLVLR